MATDRDYEEPPFDDYEEWLYYEIFDILSDQGLATAFDTRTDGRPAGYRENRRGQWAREGVDTYLPSYASANPLFIRDRLRDVSPEFFKGLYYARPPWFAAWEQVAIKDPDIVSDTLTPEDIKAALETWEGAYSVLLGQQAPQELITDYRPERVSDFDPLRASYGYQPELRPEPLRIEALDPFPLQTTRTVLERHPPGTRDKDGKPIGGRFTGEKTIRKIKTLEIPHASPIGEYIRIIDADKTRKVPKGALARIETSPPRRGHPGSYAYVVPFNGKTYAGKSLEDPRHEARRQDYKKESVQLFDHRTGEPRKLEVLVTQRSRYFQTISQLQKLIEKAQK